MEQASIEIASNFQRLYNFKEVCFMHTFTPDSLFGIQLQNQNEWHVATADGLNWMQEQGVAEVWLDTQNINIMGESLSHFYCTYRGKFFSLSVWKQV